MEKKASAVWIGSLKEGKGIISTESGALSKAPYGFNTRFEGVPGTNPEELIGAAHAGCFSMALSVQLGNAGLTAERIDTSATVSFEKIANEAKVGCPISRLLNTKITMKATFLE